LFSGVSQPVQLQPHYWWPSATVRANALFRSIPQISLLPHGKTLIASTSSYYTAILILSQLQ